MTSLGLKNPKLRFPQFRENWGKMRIKDLTEKVSIPVDVETDQFYTQIGVRSHGKGLFHKQPVGGKELGKKRVFWVRDDLFVVNIVFAWEQAIAKTTKNEVGTIASHRFPMFRPKSNLLNLDFLLFSFLTRRGKVLLELASPGGAGRNKTLGQEEFDRTKLNLPGVEEQKKIAGLLSAVYERIRLLARKEELLLEYKKGVMQQIFEQKTRFKDENGNDFPAWEELRGREVFRSYSSKDHDGTLPILAASQERGMVFRDDIGIRIQSTDESINSYKVVEPGDFVISLRSFQGGLEYSRFKGICSPAYTILKPRIKINDDFFRFYFKKEDFIERLSKTVVGIRDGKQISYEAFGGLKLKVPSLAEQAKIAGFLIAVDKKVELVSQQLEEAKTFKNGLLQQMFV